ncbi:MAG: DUF2795 domain-containing protein [Candidatus Caldarchaeum sp.]|nr:DUF2795 domain-containing protein [Candidatus Caldarchaeum sp.]
MKLDGIKAGLELRGWAGRDVFEAMNDLGIVHVTDFSKEMPRVHDGEIAYSRLFGRGVHNIYMFDDDELVEISGKADGVGSEKVLLSFHGLRMYVDAARLKVFRKTGKMPSVTGKAGAESFREVMADAVFPAAKEELLTKHGWKLFDIEAGRRARVADLLRKIPDRTYVNVDDLWADVVQVV